ncbi:hypothetical protein ACIRP2_38860 [Streptomyces sp. NPDC101194]|uniref:hypothetical protein n=1 Tax=Streptomyces sp. NPDC101194 TaxID=3366127 RepID=UPI0038179DF4
MNKIWSALAGAVMGSVLLSVGVADAAPAKYARHNDAAAQFRKAGVSWASSKGCADWNKRGCTSFTNINKTTVTGVIAFKNLSKCRVIITAGTEMGHSAGTYSHRNGYKVDMSKQDGCLDRYVPGHFKRAGARKDGTKLYKSPAGNVYAREKSHWDVLYYNGRA